MKRIALILLTTLVLTGCGAKQPEPAVKEEPAAVQEANVEAEEEPVEEEETAPQDEEPKTLKEATFTYDYVDMVLSVEDTKPKNTATIFFSTKDKLLGATIFLTNSSKVNELCDHLNASMALVCDGGIITTLGVSSDKDGNRIDALEWAMNAIKTGESSLAMEKREELYKRISSDIDEFFAEFIPED